MVLRRPPGPALRSFVQRLWAIDQTGLARPSPTNRERVLPTGDMHLAIRLTDHPVRLLDDSSSSSACIVGTAVVGGARTSSYIRDVSAPVRSVGIQLRAGAADLLFGVPAHELAERHSPLDDLWGAESDRLRARLLETEGPNEQLDILEASLLRRLPRLKGLHPAVAQALHQITPMSSVRHLVRESGYSHRRFVAVFRQAVGVTPKTYCRLLRFRSAVARMSERPDMPAVDVALTAGYADQAHFTREFREFSGLTPHEYRALRPVLPHHVPVR